MEDEKVKNLLKKFLPEHEVTYCEVEENDILGFRFKNAGVALKLKSGLEVFGASSTSDSVDSPLLYAAYELLERYAILSQEKEVNVHETKDFKYSLSNGVALHDSFSKARVNAYYEMLERHEILKSWYYNTEIKRLPTHLIEDLSLEMKNLYEMVLVDFSTMNNSSVIGIFALPNLKEMNLIYGFGCSASITEAVRKARKEFVTRLGFLWGETSEAELGPVNTPDFHQNFYLKRENLEYIREWLFGMKYPKRNGPCNQLKDVYYVNITPQGWESAFSVVRARSVESIPLFFGLPPKHIFDFPYRCDIPHPIM